MDSREFGDLVADIKAHGLLEPITRHEGQVLDGRNRYRACLHAGVAPRFEEFRGESPIAFALSKNLVRRHLTEDQRAMVATAALPHFEEEARKRQEQAGREHGRGRPGKVGADSPQPKRAPRARDQAAAAAGVKPGKIQRAKRLAKADTALAEEVRRVESTLVEAERRVTKPEPSAPMPPARPMNPGAELGSDDRSSQIARRQAEDLTGAISEARSMRHMFSELDYAMGRWASPPLETLPRTNAARRKRLADHVHKIRLVVDTLDDSLSGPPTPA